MEIIGIFFILILAFVLFRSKVNIDARSFVQKTLPLDRGVFGVYCFTGKQGSGKTYALNKFIRRHAKGKKIFSNVTFKNLDYTPITSINMLMSLRDEKHCYIVFDEIFTFIAKTTKHDPETAKKLIEFMTQMRKQKNIFITTAQEWLELPIEFRRYVRIQIECTTRPLGSFGGILNETYYDATTMKWSNLDNEYVAQLITNKYSKYEKNYMITYDTFERIRELPKFEKT